jgi:hypothetical protein
MLCLQPNPHTTELWAQISIHHWGETLLKKNGQKNGRTTTFASPKRSEELEGRAYKIEPANFNPAICCRIAQVMLISIYRKQSRLESCWATDSKYLLGAQTCKMVLAWHSLRG